MGFLHKILLVRRVRKFDYEPFRVAFVVVTEPIHNVKTIISICYDLIIDVIHLQLTE